MSNSQVLFALAVNASPLEVQGVIQSINKFFGVEDEGSITPQQVAAEQTEDDVPEVIATASGEVDKNGLPWDERIHSSNRGKNADGTWRFRRGLDEKVKTKVLAELNKTMAAPAPAPAPAAIEVPAPSLPGLPPIAAPATAFTRFVEFVVANTKSDANPTGRLTDEWVKQALAHYGVADGAMQNLAHREDLIPQIEAGIKQVLGQ